MYDRILNATKAPEPAGGPLNSVAAGAIQPIVGACKSLLGDETKLPCEIGSLSFGLLSVACCEAAAIVATSKVRASQDQSQSNLLGRVEFCPAHMGAGSASASDACEQDGLTPTPAALELAVSEIRKASCMCGSQIMSQMDAAGKILFDENSDNLIDACPVPETTAAPETAAPGPEVPDASGNSNPSTTDSNFGFWYNQNLQPKSISVTVQV